jgi:hypothetical protein
MDSLLRFNDVNNIIIIIIIIIIMLMIHAEVLRVMTMQFDIRSYV